MDVYQRRRLVALSALAALFIIVVLLIRSCGGGDESSTPLTTPIGTSGASGATALSQADFIAQGDAICLETNSSLAAVDTSDPNQAAADSAELLAGELDSLQSLSLAPGEKGETKLENLLKALQKQVQAYDERSLAVERGDDATVSELDATIDDEAANAQNAAENFGFKACGDTSKVSSSGSGGTDTSGTDTATTSVAPATTTPVTPTTATPTTPTDTGATAPPADGGTDTGGDSSGSGGLTP
jgi:hypothetical protein